MAPSLLTQISMNMGRGTVRIDKQARADGDMKKGPMCSHSVGQSLLRRVCCSRGLLPATDGEDGSVSGRVNWVLPCMAAPRGARLSSPALHIIDHTNTKARGASVRLGRIVRLGPPP